jgi:hypothetical protein
MARWRPSKGWESERALPKRSRRWGELVFYKSPKWGYIVKRVPRVPASSKRAIAFWTEWLQWMNILYKYTAPEVLIELKRQEGLFKLPARDVFSSAMNGLLWVIEDESGRRWYSMAHRERISRSLDVFSQERGSLLVRGAEIWEPLLPGQPGDVLTITDQGVPGWMPGGGGGGFIYINTHMVDGSWAWSGPCVQGVRCIRLNHGATHYVRFAIPALSPVRLRVRFIFDTYDGSGGDTVWRFRLWTTDSAGNLVDVAQAEQIIPVTSQYFVVYVAQADLSFDVSSLNPLRYVVEVARLGQDPRDTATIGTFFYCALVF